MLHVYFSACGPRTGTGAQRKSRSTGDAGDSSIERPHGWTRTLAVWLVGAAWNVGVN